MTPVVQARNLYRFFHTDDEEVQALRGVSLSVAGGEVVAVQGPSGSGKSTLLACIAGLDDPDGGEIRIEGERISRQPEPVRAATRGRSIGYLFQTGNLIEHLTVANNIRLTRRLAGRPAGNPTALLAELGLHAHGDARPATLSGGEAARAGLAVALANDPAVVVADEPTGELDTTTEATIIELLRRRARHGTGVLVATHSPAVAASADRTIRLADGQVQQ